MVRMVNPAKPTNKAHDRPRGRKTYKGHHLIEWLDREIDHHTESQDAISARAGVYDNAVRNWRAGKYMPKLDAFEAVANALGFRLEAVPLSPGERRALREHRRHEQERCGELSRPLLPPRPEALLEDQSESQP